MRLNERAKTVSNAVLFLFFTFVIGNHDLHAKTHSTLRVDALVDKNNEWALSTISDAIAQAPDDLSKPYVIKIAAGDYYEKLVISKPFITLLGDGTQNTRLYFDDYAGKKTTNGGNLGTIGSATLTIKSNNVSIENLHIENSFNFPYFDALSKDNPKRMSGMQAVAVLIDNGNDKALFKNVKMSGYQDTLYTKSGRALFLNNTISGHVDFIFGGSTAVFYKSNIVTRNRPHKTPPIGYVTAPSTSIEKAFGLVFIDCALSREAGVQDNSMGLGRPWHPTTTFVDGRYADPNAVGQTVFINTWMGAHIQQTPWHSMGGTAKSGERILFSPQDARFFEYASSGPGAHVTANRRQLSKNKAADFSFANILGEWYQEPHIQQAIEQTTEGDLVSSFNNEMPEYSIQNEYQKNKQAYPFIVPINEADNIEDFTKTISAYYDLKYKTVNGTDLHLDLFHPSQPALARPLVVMIHGGGWRSGNKSHQSPTARWLASRGFTAVSIEYRTSKKALHPAAMEDINDAIKWLKQHHEIYAIDTSKVAVIGASSGAHMATLFGTIGTNPATKSGYETVQAIVNIDGLVDLTSATARIFEDTVGKTSYAALWLGGRYQSEPKRWHAASPLEYLSVNTPPTLFVNSSQPRFHIGRDAFLAHLIQNKTYQEVYTIPDTPHTFWLFHPWVDNLRSILASFLNTVFLDEKTSAMPTQKANMQAAIQNEFMSYSLNSESVRQMQQRVIDLEREQAGQQKKAPTITKTQLKEIRRKDKDEQTLPQNMLRNMLTWQTPAGGWSKNIDMYTKAREKGQIFGEKNYIPTFDNNATIMQIIQLKHAIGQNGGDKNSVKDIKESLHKAINYLLSAQYPNGGFPQTYPLVGGYHDLVTYNDDVMANIIALLNDMRKAPKAYALNASQLVEVNTHFNLALQRIMKDQVTVNSQQGAWGQQHDPLTYQLKSARAYEMAALSSMETARLLEKLMQIDGPNKALKTTIEKGINWLKAEQIIGIRWQRHENKNSEFIVDKTVQGLWPRFIDQDTGKPVFGDRNGQIYATVQEVSIERQNGYAWYHSSQLSALTAYKNWHRQWQTN